MRKVFTNYNLNEVWRVIQLETMHVDSKIIHKIQICVLHVSQEIDKSVSALETENVIK